jgi:ABC-type sugar transport system substrate-binding protein
MEMTLPQGVHVVSLRGRWTAESAQRAVESWLRLNVLNKTQIDAVGAQNDLMAIGARKAFEGIANVAEQERWLRLPFTGVDGLAKTGQAWVRSGTLSATVVVPTNTGQAIATLVEAFKTGKDVPEKSFTTPESFPVLEKLAPKGEKVAPAV